MLSTNSRTGNWQVSFQSATGRNRNVSISNFKQLRVQLTLEALYLPCRDACGSAFVQWYQPSVADVAEGLESIRNEEKGSQQRRQLSLLSPCMLTSKLSSAGSQGCECCEAPPPQPAVQRSRRKPAWG